METVNNAELKAACPTCGKPILIKWARDEAGGFITYWHDWTKQMGSRVTMALNHVHQPRPQP